MNKFGTTLGLIGLPHLGFEMWWKYRRHFAAKTVWNDTHRAFFVHIPKTAGTSIYDSLAMQKLPFTHAPARILRDLYPTEFQTYFSFAFVRNPWDRMVSTFEFLRNETVWPDQKEWALQHIGNQSFREFILRLNREPVYRASIMSYNFFYSQTYFITDRRGQTIVKRIFKFEDLAAGFVELAERFGAHQPLAHSRKTQSRAGHEAYYDAETWAIVGNLYAEDVAAFGYDQPGSIGLSENDLARHVPVTLAP